jgi:hypothetical protein
VSVSSTGFLSVGCEPSAQVLVDGTFVRETPMLRHELPAGPHTVKLIAPGYEAKTFKVTVNGGAEARKIWNFETAAWVDE